MSEDHVSEQQSLDLKIEVAEEASAEPSAATAASTQSATVAAQPVASPSHSAAPVADQKKDALNAKSFDDEVSRRMSRVDELEKSFTSLRTESEALRNRLDQELLNSRVNWAANKGVKGLTRDDLAMIMPKVDPSTPEGLAALDAWRHQRSDLFPEPTLPKQTTPDQMLAKVDPTRNHFWNSNKFREIASQFVSKD